MKKYIYILFFIALAISISSSFIILHKKQYKPRTHLLNDLKNCNCICSHFQKKNIDFEIFSVKVKLYGNNYELIVQGNKNDFQVWIKTKNSKNSEKVYTNLIALVEKNNRPIRNNNSERFNNFYESLYFNEIDLHITVENTSCQYLKIFDNWFIKTMTIKPESPPPKEIM